MKELRVPSWVFAARLGDRQAGALAVLIALWTFAPWQARGPAKVYCSNAALAERLGVTQRTLEKRLRALRVAGWIRPTLIARKGGWVPGHELAWRHAAGFEVRDEESTELDELHLPAWVLAVRLDARQAGAELVLAALWTYARWGVDGAAEVTCSLDELGRRLGIGPSTLDKRLRVLRTAGWIRAARVATPTGLEHGYALAWSEPPPSGAGATATEDGSRECERLPSGAGATSIEDGRPPSGAGTAAEGGRAPSGADATSIEDGSDRHRGRAAPPSEAVDLLRGRSTSFEDGRPPSRAGTTSFEGRPDLLRGRVEPPSRAAGTNYELERIGSKGARTTSAASRAARAPELDAFAQRVLAAVERVTATAIHETQVWPIVERWQEGDCSADEVDTVLAYFAANRSQHPYGPIRLFERRTWSWTRQHVLGRATARRSANSRPSDWTSPVTPAEEVNAS